MEFGDIVKTIGSLPVAIGKEIARNPIGFITDELLGLDDFRRAIKYGGEGDFLKMLKSLGAGTFELGSTVIPGGQILKGTKPLTLGAKALRLAGREVTPRVPSMILPTTRKVLGRELPAVSTKILSRIPGATEVIASDIATRAPVLALTPAGKRGLQAFRLAETGQWLDAGNALSAGMGGPFVGVGTAPQIRADLNRELQKAKLEDIIAMLNQDQLGYGVY